MYRFMGMQKKSTTVWGHRRGTTTVWGHTGGTLILNGRTKGSNNMLEAQMGSLLVYGGQKGPYYCVRH